MEGAKVTGTARYAADDTVQNIVYGLLVESNIAKGRIKSIDTKDAEKAALPPAAPFKLAILFYLVRLY